MKISIERIESFPEHYKLCSCCGAINRAENYECERCYAIDKFDIEGGGISERVAEIKEELGTENSIILEV